MRTTSIYENSIKNRRKDISKLLNNIRKHYEGLSNKDSFYAKDVKGLIDLHSQVCKIYNDAPDSLRKGVK